MAAPAEDPGLALALPAAPPMRAGHWTCLTCSKHNRPSHLVCNRCKTPNLSGGQPTDAGSADDAGGKPLALPRSSASTMDSTNAPSAHVSAVAKNEQKYYKSVMYLENDAEARAGDWKCLSCSKHNRPSQLTCNRCISMKLSGGQPKWDRIAVQLKKALDAGWGDDAGRKPSARSRSSSASTTASSSMPAHPRSFSASTSTCAPSSHDSAVTEDERKEVALTAPLIYRQLGLPHWTTTWTATTHSLATYYTSTSTPDMAAP
jgi:hypothetical protein